MTIRYEANPPKIASGADMHGPVTEFIERIRSVAGCCDAVHLTEDVLGFKRISPIEVGRIIRERIPGLPITISLRVREKTGDEIRRFVERCVGIGASGILVVMGDPPRDGRPDSGHVPSSVVGSLHRLGIDSKIDLYLSIPNSPSPNMIKRKLEAAPRGFMTQVVQSVAQVEEIACVLRGFSVIPIVLFPSEKNARSADFLGIDTSEYGDDFSGFVGRIHEITGDVLITSPNDFGGLVEFLQEHSHRTKYSASG